MHAGMVGAAHLAMDCCSQGDSCQSYPGGGPGGGAGGGYPSAGYPGYNPLQDLQAFSYSHYPEYHSPYQSCAVGGDGGGCVPASSQLDYNNGYSYGSGYGYGGYSPDYVYNPKEARLRKAMRDQVRSRTQGGRPAAGTPGTTGPVRPQSSPQNSPQDSPPQVKKKMMLSPRRAVEQQPQQQQQQHQQQRLGHSVREHVEAGLLYDDAFVDMGYHQQDMQSMQSWYPMPMQDPSPSMRQWPSADCLAPSPHVSPFGGRVTLGGPGSGPGGVEDMDDMKMKLEPTSQDGQAFGAIYKEPNGADDRPGSLGLDDGLDSGMPAAPAPTRLPGFQETFCSNDVGLASRGGLFYSSAALELQVQVSCAASPPPSPPPSGPPQGSAPSCGPPCGPTGATRGRGGGTRRGRGRGGAVGRRRPPARRQRRSSSSGLGLGSDDEASMVHHMNMGRLSPGEIPPMMRGAYGAHDRLPGMPNGMPTRMPNGMPNGVANGMPNGMPSGMHHDVPSGMPNAMPSGMPNGMSSGMPNGMSSSMPNGMSSGMPNGMSSGMSNGMSSGFLNGMSSGMPNGMHHDVPNGMSSGMPSGAPSRMPNGVHSSMRGGMSPGMSGGMSPAMSGGMSPGMSGGMSPGMSGGMSPGMPSGMLGGLSSGTSPRLSNTMSPGSSNGLHGGMSPEEGLADRTSSPSHTTCGVPMAPANDLPTGMGESTSPGTPCEPPNTDQMSPDPSSTPQQSSSGPAEDMSDGLSLRLGGVSPRVSSSEACGSQQSPSAPMSPTRPSDGTSEPPCVLDEATPDPRVSELADGLTDGLADGMTQTKEACLVDELSKSDDAVFGMQAGMQPDPQETQQQPNASPFAQEAQSPQQSSAFSGAQQSQPSPQHSPAFAQQQNGQHGSGGFGQSSQQAMASSAFAQPSQIMHGALGQQVGMNGFGQQVMYQQRAQPYPARQYGQVYGQQDSWYQQGYQWHGYQQQSYEYQYQQQQLQQQQQQQQQQQWGWGWNYQRYGAAAAPSYHQYGYQRHDYGRHYPNPWPREDVPGY